MFLVTSACENPNVLKVIYVLKRILDLGFIIVPIVLILFLMLDFIKMMMGSEDVQKKQLKLVVNRIIYSMVIFFVPTIVSIANGMLLDLGVDYGSCLENSTKEKIAVLQTIYDAKENEEEQLRQASLIERKMLYAKEAAAERETKQAYYRKVAEEQAKNAQSAKGNNSETDLMNEVNRGGEYNSMASAMLAIAKKELGYTETGDNINKFGASFGADGVAWCAFFVRWVMQNTNYNGKNLLTDVVEKTVRTPSIGSALGMIYTFANGEDIDFMYGPHYGGNYVPKVGDIVFFKSSTWDKKIYPMMSAVDSHVAIVESVLGNTLYTIDGNSSTNCDKVAKSTRKLTDTNIVGYGVWYSK